MKKALLISAAALLLAACGSGNNGPKVNQYAGGANAGGDNTTPAGEDNPDNEPDVATNDKWLRVEATGEGDRFKWQIDGKDVSAEKLGKQLESYAAETNELNGMPGPNQDDISSNPVVFASGPKTSSRAFCAFIEKLVMARTYRFVVELNTPGQPARRIWQQLPVDRGLRAADENGHDGLPDPADFARAYTDYKLHLNAYVRAGNSRFEIHKGGQKRVPVSEAAFKITDLLKDGWNNEVYTKAREKLAAALMTAQGTGKNAKDWVEICPLEDAVQGGKYAPWSVLFMAMDAVDLANNDPDRGNRPRLFTSFHFTDALSDYK
jgi:hypothetical protein